MYMSLIYFPGKTTDTGTKTPHTPRSAALLRKTLSGGGGGGQGGWGGWQRKYLCLCLCVCLGKSPKSYIWYIFGHNQLVELENICFIVNFSKSCYRCTENEMERWKVK